MAVGALHRENEIKVAVPDLPALESRLRDLGFTILHPRVLESNIIYDTPEGTLRARGELIRLRQAGASSTFTYKGPATVTKHKEREELEVSVSDTSSMALILQRLGYMPRFRYEKYRTEWAIAGDEGVLMVDETPVGIYMEIEGPAAWIDRLAADLGYTEADYVNLSYARLYARECEKQGVVPTHMLFAEDPVPQPEGA